MHNIHSLLADFWPPATHIDKGSYQLNAALSLQQEVTHSNRAR